MAPSAPLPFEHVIPESDRDPAVKATLTTDPDALAAVLAWAVAGCLAWQRQGIGQPAIVRRKTAELRAGFDPLGEFFTQLCVFAPGAEAQALTLRQEYEHWAREMGAAPINDRQWSERLKAKGCTRQRRRGGGGQATYWRGIGLLSDPQQAELCTPCTPEATLTEDSLDSLTWGS